MSYSELTEEQKKMSDLEILDAYRKGVLKTKFCTLRYETKYGQVCNHYCKYCSLKGYESILKNSKDSNEIVEIKLLKEEIKDSCYFRLSTILRIINKTIDDLNSAELLALFDYFSDCEHLYNELRDLEEYDFSERYYDDFARKIYEDMEDVEIAMIHRAGVEFDVNSGDSYGDAINKAIKILERDCDKAQ